MCCLEKEFASPVIRRSMAVGMKTVSMLLVRGRLRLKTTTTPGRESWEVGVRFRA